MRDYLCIALLICAVASCGNLAEIPGHAMGEADKIEFRVESKARVVLTKPEEIAEFRAWVEGIKPAPLASLPATSVEVVAFRDGVAYKVGDISLPTSGTVIFLSQGRLFIGPSQFFSVAANSPALAHRYFLFGREL